MAAPNVRAKAMADKDQQQVWSGVGKQELHGGNIGSRRSEPGTSSYAGVMNNEE
jgi:hypothetical protein